MIEVLYNYVSSPNEKSMLTAIKIDSLFLNLQIRLAICYQLKLIEDFFTKTLDFVQFFIFNISF